MVTPRIFIELARIIPSTGIGIWSWVFCMLL